MAAEQGSHHSPQRGPVHDEASSDDGHMSPRTEVLIEQITKNHQEEMGRLAAEKDQVIDAIREQLEEMEGKLKKYELEKGRDVTGGAGGSNMKPATYKLFRDSGAREFDGKTDPSVALKWIEATEAVFELSHVREEDKVVYACGMLVDRARSWWNVTRESMTEDEKKGVTWESFIVMFRKQFCPDDMIWKMEKDFLDLKQGERSVMEYEEEFHRLASFAKLYIPTEEQKIRRFVNGLNYKIQMFVMYRDMTTFSKVVELARVREQALLTKASTESPAKKQRVEQVSSAPQSFRPPRSSQRRQSQSVARSQGQSFSLQMV